MFTGLIEAVGTVVSLDRLEGGYRLLVGGTLVPELRAGDSLAVNGVCLTVAAHDGGRAAFDIGPETARVTALGALAPGTRVNAFGHLGDGNIHYNVLVESSHDAGAVNRIVHDVVAAFGGSISAEHGIGQYRVGELARYRASAEMELARTIKRALDPDKRLNPGKVLLP